MSLGKGVLLYYNQKINPVTKDEPVVDAGIIERKVRNENWAKGKGKVDINDMISKTVYKRS